MSIAKGLFLFNFSCECLQYLLSELCSKYSLLTEAQCRKIMNRRSVFFISMHIVKLFVHHEFNKEWMRVGIFFNSISLLFSLKCVSFRYNIKFILLFSIQYYNRSLFFANINNRCLLSELISVFVKDTSLPLKDV